MIVLCWDIDGTLLTTNKAGLAAWEGAIEKVCGFRPDLSQFPMSGLSDAAISSRLLKFFEMDPTAKIKNDVLRVYEQLLPESLYLKQGEVLPGVLAILQHIQKRKDVGSILLTGNTRSCAQVKLKHYGLGAYFSEGAFGDSSEDRSEIAKLALKQIQGKYGEIELSRVFVIGDTPYDIECGKAIGANTIAVATSIHTQEDLAKHTPWLLLPQLPTPAVFFKALGI